MGKVLACVAGVIEKLMLFNKYICIYINTTSCTVFLGWRRPPVNILWVLNNIALWLNSLKEYFIVHDVRNFVHFAFLSSGQGSSYYCLTLIVFCFLWGRHSPHFHSWRPIAPYLPCPAAPDIHFTQ
jgi:hypothetical protein